VQECDRSRGRPLGLRGPSADTRVPEDAWQSTIDHQ